MTNEERGCFQSLLTNEELVKAREEQSAGWAAAWAANNAAFELTVEKTDDEIDSLWIADDCDDSMVDNVDAFFAGEDDSVNDALLFCDAVEELNERG